MNISLLRPGFKPETLTVPVNSYKTFSNGTLARNPFVPGTNNVQLIYADLGHIIPVDENGKPIAGAPQPIYNNNKNDAYKAAATASPDLTDLGWVLADESQASINPKDPGADTLVQYVRVVKTTETKTVSQTVKYAYADGVTEGRPALPKDNVQTATFTRTVLTNPVSGHVISDTWTKPQKFTAVTSPAVEGFYADQEQDGGNAMVTQDTPDAVYTVLYAGPSQETETKTVKYEYQDGVTEGRPALPESRVQTLTFTRTIKKDPQGAVISDTWSDPQNFTKEQTPELKGYYASQDWAGSTAAVTHNSCDTEYIVYYAQPNTTTREKVIFQTVHYQYQDGETQNRPALPEDNVQLVKFNETLKTNTFTGEIVYFGWDPAYQKFAAVKTPTINGYYADLAVAGGDDHVIHEDSDTYYFVNYAAPISTVAETKNVTQTIKYEYADGITAGRPELPDTDVQALTFNRIVLTNPFTGAVLSDTWTPAQKFTVIETPTINGFYADLAQAGSDQVVTHESPDMDYVVKYLAPDVTTEQWTVTQTVKYEYADGITANRPTLPATNVQKLTFNRKITKNPITGEIISDVWTPAQQNFQSVVTPKLAGFTPDRAVIDGQTVNYTSANLDYVVKYTAQQQPTEPTQPMEPTTPSQPTEPSTLTAPTSPSTPSEPSTPETPLPVNPTTPATPAEPAVPSPKPVVPEATNRPNDKLPQTGNQDTSAVAGLGLLAGMLSLFGLGKRKRQ